MSFPFPLQHSETERLQLITLILEVGVAFHSVIIGVTLGALGGDEFVPLWIALLFHQFFEGFALGVTVLDAKFSGKFASMMVCLYGLSTPVGVLIGILIHSSYSETSREALIVQGTLVSRLSHFCVEVLLHCH